MRWMEPVVASCFKMKLEKLNIHILFSSGVYGSRPSHFLDKPSISKDISDIPGIPNDISGISNFLN